MKALKLREQSNEELSQLSTETSKELQLLKLKRSAGGSSEHPMRVRTLRRDIARIRTVLTERGIRK
jgi:large subunit ribosomal protein L29